MQEHACSIPFDSVLMDSQQSIGGGGRLKRKQSGNKTKTLPCPHCQRLFARLVCRTHLVLPRSSLLTGSRPTGTSSETYSYPHQRETFRLRDLQQVLCPQRPACPSRETRPSRRRGAAYHKKVTQTSSVECEQCCQSGSDRATRAPNPLHVL